MPGGSKVPLKNHIKETIIEIYKDDSESLSKFKNVKIIKSKKSEKRKK